MGKTALVTGSGAGIGKAIALRLAQEGYDVAVNARRENMLRDVADQIQSLGRKASIFCGDVSDSTFCKNMVEGTVSELGGLDVLVNNAGTCPVRLVSEVTPEIFRQTLQTNLVSAYSCAHYASEYMKRHGGGVIVNAASQASFSQSLGNVEYCTSKWAMRGMTRELAAELASAHIRVVAYAPGVVWTEMMESIADGAEKMGLAKERFIKSEKRRIPLGTFQTPEDVAALVAFLVSDDACNITGQTIMVNGGEIMC